MLNMTTWLRILSLKERSEQLVQSMATQKPGHRDDVIHGPEHLPRYAFGRLLRSSDEEAHLFVRACDETWLPFDSPLVCGSRIRQMFLIDGLRGSGRLVLLSSESKQQLGGIGKHSSYFCGNRMSHLARAHST